MAEVIHLRCLKQRSPEPVGSPAQPGEIVGAVTAISETLRRIKRNEGREHEIHVLSTDLLHLLALVEREPQIECTFDKLYEAARLFVLRSRSGDPPDDKCLQGIEQAYRHLEMALATAQFRTLESCK